jgi:hypothetical protein
MRYMLLIYSDPALRQQEIGEQNQADEMQAYGTYTEGLIKRGVMRGGDPLQGADSATTIRVRNGQRLVTDGPFVETKEVLGGYYLIEARDLDEAIEIAAACPGARTGAMEVRPIMELSTEAAGQAQAQATPA